MSDNCDNPLSPDIDINKPRYNQDYYVGRAKHFFITTFPLNVLASSSALENAKTVVTKYRNKEKLCLTEDELWSAKHLYDSAYHPDTGELVILPGRMSFQVPGNMMITGGMMTFYKRPISVIFWQWLNQAFNAVVNHSNRSGDHPISDEELMQSFALATTSAVVVALALNSLVRHMSPLIGRLVPFTAVAAANCVNIPFMRHKEIDDGIPVTDAEGKRIALSKNAAIEAILQVIISRIVMATPSMVLVPFIMNRMELRGTLCRYPWSALPMTVLFTGIILTFATPCACALFKQQASIPFERLEASLREVLKDKAPPILHYNKGL